MTEVWAEGEMPEVGDPKFIAGVDLLAHTGAREFQIRYSDDEEPTVWFAVAIYDGEFWETNAARTPTLAVMRLCDTLINGGICTNCGRTTGFDPEATSEMLLGPAACWFTWDEATLSFVRGCV